MPAPTKPLEERFWPKVKVGTPGECWEWQACLSHKNYGKFFDGEIMRLAHRISWQIANDDTVPSGLAVCHSCDNPKCVNPAHLWLGTRADNNRDMVAKGRHYQGSKTQCCRGHPYTEKSTLIGRNGARRCRKCQNERSRDFRARQPRKEKPAMGWISKHHMQHGGSINRNPAKQRKGPLRTIVAVLRESGGMFDPARVELECGHEVYSDGQFKARCDKCAEQSL